MFVDRDALYARELRKDALAAADKERLIRQIRQTRTPVQIPYRLWMSRLGEQLITWGQHLQTRYAGA